MIRITISPKTTSWPCAEPTRGTPAEIVGRRPMKRAPPSTPQSEPSPATAAPMRISSERRTPNSFGCAKPFVTSTNGFAQPNEFGVLLRSEEHTSELQSPHHLVSRLLLQKKQDYI